MNSRNHSYISFARILLILALCFVSGKAWGESTTYYAQLTAKVDNTGGGKVYASNNDDTTPSEKSFADSSNAYSDNTSGDALTFYAYASPDTGYKFSNWNGNESPGDNFHKISVPVTPTSTNSNAPTTETRIAYFTPITYHITLVANGGNVSQTETEIVIDYNIKQQIELPTPTRTGYKFDGWYVDGTADGNWTRGTKYTGSQSNMYGTVTLTAQWHKVYSITMDLNGGSGLVSPLYYTSEGDGGKDSDNHSLTTSLPQSDPTKTGYKFAGWEVDGSDDGWEGSYETLSGVALRGKKGNVTLTAQWHQVYSIELNDGNNVIGTKYYTSEGDTGPYSQDRTLINTLTQSDPTKTGYKFAGWKVEGSEGGWEGSYKTLSGVPLSGKKGNVTLTAQWELNIYTLTLDPNGGTVDPSSKDYDITQTFNLPTPEYPGHTFVGWYVFGAADGKWALETKYTDSQSGMYGTVTLKAKWTTASYEIKYECAGGAIKDLDPIEYYDIDSSFSLPKDVTKPGYPFEVWKVTATETPSSWKIDDAYGPGESFEAGQYGNVTFTAQWGSAIPYNISFDLNGGPDSLPDKNYSIESNSVNLPVPPTWNGYKFKGWKPSADSEEDQGNWKSSDTYPSGENKLNGKYGDVTLVAQWEAIPYNITYKDKGKDVTTLVPKTYTILSDESLPIYTKSKYAFVGWKVISNSIEGSWNKDDVITAGTALKDKWGDVIFEAQWEAGKYNITLDCAGGTLDSEYPKMYDSETTLILPKPSKEGCQFLNWKVTNVGEGENNWKVGDTYEAGNEIKGQYGSVTLTAQWNALPGYIKICLTGLKNGNSAIFDVSYKSTTRTIAIDSAECESGVLIEIPEAGAGTDVTVSPKTGWLVNYPGLNTPQLYYIKATEHGTPETAHVFDFGQQSYENIVSETYKEF